MDPFRSPMRTVKFAHLLKDLNSFAYVLNFKIFPIVRMRAEMRLGTTLSRENWTPLRYFLFLNLIL